MNLLWWFLFGVFFMMGALVVNCVAVLILIAIEEIADRRSEKRLKERSEKRFSEFMEDMKDTERVHRYDMHMGD